MPHNCCGRSGTTAGYQGPPSAPTHYCCRWELARRQAGLAPVVVVPPPTEPSMRRPQACLAPAAICLTPVKPAVISGVVLSVPLPSPRWPRLFTPQHQTLALTRTGDAKHVRPQATQPQNRQNPENRADGPSGEQRPARFCRHFSRVKRDFTRRWQTDPAQRQIRPWPRANRCRRLVCRRAYATQSSSCSSSQPSQRSSAGSSSGMRSAGGPRIAMISPSSLSASSGRSAEQATDRSAKST